MILSGKSAKQAFRAVGIFLLLSHATFTSAQAPGMQTLSTEFIVSELSSQGLNFADIGVINGLPTFVAPGEGSSMQMQGPPEKLTAMTLRWNGRYVKADETRDYFVGLLETMIPQINKDFFFQLQLRSTHEVIAGNTKVNGSWRKLGNQVSWTIEVRFDHED